MVRRGDLKAIYDPRSDVWELFDLATDPGQEHDVAAERKGDLRQMAGLLHRFRLDFRQRLAAAHKNSRTSESGGLTPEDRERLRSLGYLGGT